MPISTPSYVIIGKIGAPHGVKGWLKIHSYTQDPFQILTYTPWWLVDTQDNYRPIALESGHPHGKSILVKFQAIDSPEAARLLTNQLIYIQREQLPALAENEYYWSDLVGLNVINQQGECYGKVIYLIETGANDVLVVQGSDKKEHAIPYLMHKVIKKIDLSQKEIIVDWELI